MSKPNDPFSRRHFLRDGVRTAGLSVLGAAAAVWAAKSHNRRTVWQIDPSKCIACNKCSTHCVLSESAVKCVHAYAMCGYCDLCTGYLSPDPKRLDTGAENELCPTGAIIRTYVEDPYFEYTIDEPKCIGCGKCVLGCNAFGNGSLFLQVRHDRCVNCNECAIAVACPVGAFVRVPADRPYLLKDSQ
jgi:electron transport complex protein RnfB